MTESKTAPKVTVKDKRVRHASAQASYMERKRSEGKEWFAAWVPGAAKDSFKKLTKRSNEDDRAPSKSYISAVENALDEKIPAWAQNSQTLLNLWLVSQNDILVDFGDTVETEKKEKKKKKKKKK